MSNASRPLPDRENDRQKVRDALQRHRKFDSGATVREQIGAQIGILLMMFGIFLVGTLPVSPTLRIPFLWSAFMAAFFIGWAVKQALDRQSSRIDD